MPRTRNQDDPECWRKVRALPRKPSQPYKAPSIVKVQIVIDVDVYSSTLTDSAELQGHLDRLVHDYCDGRYPYWAETMLLGAEKLALHAAEQNIWEQEHKRVGHNRFVQLPGRQTAVSLADANTKHRARNLHVHAKVNTHETDE